MNYTLQTLKRKVLYNPKGYLILILLSFPWLLKAQDLASLNYSTTALQQETARRESNAIPLNKILDLLSKEFNVKFAINDKVIEDKYSQFERKKYKSLEEALENVLDPLNLKYKKIDIYYVIQSKDEAEKLNHYNINSIDNLELKADLRSSGINFNRMVNNYFTPASVRDITITGTVISSENEALPGVTVTLKGTTTGTITDVSGTYSLSVPDGSGTLVFSYIGFVSQEVAINNQNIINVKLAPDVQALSEVVVIGYGTQKKSDLTGSVGSVKVEQLQERQAASLNQALQGRIPGVNVNVNSGRPGGQTNIRIRGFSSINSSNNPLYVIDNVILPMSNQVNNSNPIDFINPADIESINVLKDASATAIYGARGANGVILITTKKGSQSGGRVTYDTQFSTTTIGPNDVDMLNAKEFIAIEDQAYQNSAIYDPAGWASGNYKDPKLKRTNPRLFDANGNPLYDTDWIKESTQSKLSHNHQLTVSGSNAGSSYGVSAGYRDEKGLLLNSYLKRYSGRVFLDNKVKKWLTVGGSVSYNYQQENMVDIGTGGLNATRMMTEAIPIIPVKFPNGEWAGNYHYPGMEGGENPVNIMTNRTFKVNTQTTLGNIYANITLAKGLEFKSILGTNVVTRDINEYNGRSLHSISAGSKGRAVLEDNKETYWSFEDYLTYNTTFGTDHSFTGMLGLSWQKTTFFYDRLEARGFISDYYGTNNMGSATEFSIPGSGSNLTDYQFNSYFGRFNYGFKNKYLLTFTGRIDGSSKFGENNKYGFFPSAAVAWRISDEPFIKENLARVSNLKLRASYGLTGNSEIASYSGLPSFGSGYFYIFNNIRNTGVGISRLGNPDLEWEKTAQSDVGLEVGLFENRISFEVDAYYRKTTDMLLLAPIPRASGYGAITKNIGSMENKGLEFALTTVNVQTPDLSWTTTFNVAMNRNKVLSLATPSDLFSGNPGFTNPTGIIRVGESVGSFYGLTRLGIWSTAEEEEAKRYTYRGGKQLKPGDIKYLDRDNNGQINDADRTIIGNNNPDAYGTLLNTVRYKGFDLTLDIQYSYGNDILNQTKHSAEDRVSIANSYSTVLDAWTPQNQNTMVPAVRDTRAGYVTNVDTRWVEDGSFIRGRNLLIGYNFSSAITDKLKLSRLRIQGSVQNFFVITNYSGYDPEVTTYGSSPFAQGQVFFDYPKPTIYSIGLSVGL